MAFNTWHNHSFKYIFKHFSVYRIKKRIYRIYTSAYKCTKCIIKIWLYTVPSDFRTVSFWNLPGKSYCIANHTIVGYLAPALKNRWFRQVIDHCWNRFLKIKFTFIKVFIIIENTLRNKSHKWLCLDLLLTRFVRWHRTQTRTRADFGHEVFDHLWIFSSRIFQ